MKLLIAWIMLSVLLCGFSIPWSIRTIARIATDKMLYGKKTPTKKCINRCVRVLTWSNKWITTHAHTDLIRIRKLNAMLEEMQKPQG